MLVSEVSEVQSSCPICHDNEYVNHSIARYASAVYLQKVCCTKCDFIFSKIRPKWDWMAENIYSSTAYNPGSALEARRYRRYKNIAEVFKKVIPKCSTLLDVGAGSGFGTKAFFDAGFEVVGIEPDSRSSSVKDSFNDRFYILQNTIEDYNQTNKRQFDVVTFIHCLEHIYDPRAVLESIAHVVNDEGYLYIEIPDKKNISFFDWTHLEHTSYFSFGALVTLLAEIGFVPFCRVYPKTRPYGPTHLAILFKKTRKTIFNFSQLIADEAIAEASSNEGVSFKLLVDKSLVFDTAVIQDQLNSLSRARFTNKVDTVHYEYFSKPEQSKTNLVRALFFIFRLSPRSLIKYGFRILFHKIKSKFSKDDTFENFRYLKYANH